MNYTKIIFDRYVKISSSGEELPITSMYWVAVLDKETNLVWESNYCRDRMQWDDMNNRVNDVNYSNNGLGLCNKNDWRVPTLDELASLIVKPDKSILIKSKGPTINSMLFPNTKTDCFWSSTSYESEDKYAAACVDFDTGNIVPDATKAFAKFVRLVRTK